MRFFESQEFLRLYLEDSGPSRLTSSRQAGTCTQYIYEVLDTLYHGLINYKDTKP
jgi:hypothetical protein